MRCVVTAGPSYEPLDRVRRLTNFSTGKLGIELAGFLTDFGHQVVLLKGSCATYHCPRKPYRLIEFTTALDLSEQLQALSQDPFEAVFHAAAVSDFRFGRVWMRSTSGDMQELSSGKLSSQHPNLLAELTPNPKIIRSLRAWYAKAWIVGWKYEVDGDRASTLASGKQQLIDNQTDACTVNGPAYGEGFGIVTKEGMCSHFPGPDALYLHLAQQLERFAHWSNAGEL